MGAKKKRFSYENVQQWHLRTCMAFLIDNIQYYLQVGHSREMTLWVSTISYFGNYFHNFNHVQVDVLDGQFSILTEKVKGTRDFEQIQVAHRVFVNDVSANTFVLMKPVIY